MKKVAIVTVNFNGEQDTFELLDSMKRLTIYDLRFTIIVVDNGSSDNFVEKASKKYPEIDILQNGQNLGFSGGFNRGIEHALIWGADYVLIINNDAKIQSPDLLTKLINTIESKDNIGLVAPKIYFEKGYEFYKDKYKVDELGKVIWYGGGELDWDNVMSRHFGIDQVDDGSFDEVKEASFVTGCCILIKAQVFEKAGLFDEKYFAYYEDNDFSERAGKAGFKKYYDGRAFISHKVSQTSEIGSSVSDYYITRNRLFFGMEYASGRTKFALWREALKHLFFGRPYQKKAVLDFLKGKTGPMEPQIWNEKANYQTKLSIVSVNYNTPDLIDNLLKSIQTHAIPESNSSNVIPDRDAERESSLDSGSQTVRNDNYEVIILDNGSEKSCSDVVKKYEGVHFIQNPENTGFTGGYNKAMKYSGGKYILMLNSDIEVKEDSLEQIIKEAENYKDNAIVSGSLYFPDGTLQDSAFYLPSISGAIKEYFLGLKGSFFMYAPAQSKNTKVEAAAMACFLIPRKILNKAGFLDERLFTYFEDVDYCRRLKKMGIPIYYTPKAKFLHHHGATGKRLKEGKAYEMLQRAAKIYYGETYYKLLSFTLRVAQKLSWVKTPVAR